MRIQEFHNAPYFNLVLLTGAPGKAGRKAHLHLRVYAAGVARVGIQLLVTTADLEKVQEFRRKMLGGNLRRKRAVVIRPVSYQAASGITAGEATTQIDLEKGRRFEAQTDAVLPGIIMLVKKIIQPLRFKCGPHDLPFNPAREVPQVKHP